jgi:tRNA U34 5-methylaminomethyl-2-thiouridine-forming methyltransferase MnmC
LAGKHILKLTDDGSHTLFVPLLNEHYHSTHGAIQESQHVYINAGLSYCKKQQINILEIGFGTGLNALLAAIYAENNNLNFNYTTYELYPINSTVVESLNYGKQLNEAIFSDIHKAVWNTKCKISSGFSLLKIEENITSAVLDTDYDVIFFDAFAPEVQPEMWTEKVFEKIYNTMNMGAVLTTYCAKGVVQRTLKQVGFIIERLPGPPGKREIIRAIK